MPNRSHRNSGLRKLHQLQRDGIPHASQRVAVAQTTSLVNQYLFLGDVLAGLARLPAACIRLAVCDPPYNLRMADWDQHARYLDWAQHWLTEIERVLLPHGSLVVFGGFQFQDESGGDLLELMTWLRSRSSLRLVNVIVWHYPNGMSAQRFFANRHEEVVWYAKGKHYVFNLDAVREPFDEATRRRYARDKRLRPESLAKGKNPTNVWRIGRLNGNAHERTGHPTQKPRALMERLVLALSHPGELVLDPFAGSCVTAHVARRLGRGSISIDSDPLLPAYFDKATGEPPSPLEQLRDDLEAVAGSNAPSDAP